MPGKLVFEAECVGNPMGNRGSRGNPRLRVGLPFQQVYLTCKTDLLQSVYRIQAISRTAGYNLVDDASNNRGMYVLLRLDSSGSIWH